MHKTAYASLSLCLALSLSLSEIMKNGIVTPMRPITRQATLLAGSQALQPCIIIK